MAEEPTQLSKPKCGAPTTKGTPCKMPVDLAGMRCRYHNDELKVHKDRVFPAEGPILPPPLWALVTDDDGAYRALRVKVNTAGTRAKTDEPGWIYVYYLEGDDDSLYFKIGRTSAEDPRDRIAQWPGAKLRYAIKVPFNKMAESMIHMVLTAYRLKRYVFKTKKGGGIGDSGKMYMTTRFTDDALRKDAAYRRVAYATQEAPAPYSKHVWEQVRAAFLKEQRDITINFGTRSKEIEWFKAPLSTIKKVIKAVAAALTTWDAQAVEASK